MEKISRDATRKRNKVSQVFIQRSSDQETLISPHNSIHHDRDIESRDELVKHHKEVEIKMAGELNYMQTLKFDIINRARLITDINVRNVPRT